MTNEVQLPRNAEMERVVLGVLLLSESAEQIREAEVTADCFMAFNRETYRALRDLAERGESINPVTLRAELEERESKVDPAYIAGLYEGVPRFANSAMATEFRKLRDLAARRAILRHAEHWRLEAQSHDCDVDKIVERMRAAAADLGAGTPETAPHLAISWGEACLMEFPPQEYILNGVVRGEVVNCSAITERGKSTLWRNIALSMCVGRGFAPVVDAGPPRRILYLDFETRWPRLYPDITKMLGKFTQAERALVSENFHVIADCRIDNWPLSLSLKPHWAFLEAEVRRVKPDVVIIDTLSVAFNIENEQDNAEATRVMKKMAALAEKWGCAVVFLHHIGKMKQEEGATAQAVYRSRGASAYSGCAHAIFNLLPDSASKERFTLECPKLKGEKWPNAVFDIDKETRWCEPANPATVPKAEPTPYEQVIGVFNGLPLKSGDVKKLLPKLNERTVERTLKLAVEKGELLSPTRGTYRKPDPQPAENPGSDIPTSPIGGVGMSESAQPVECAEDSELFNEWPENVDVGTSDGDLEADDDSYLDAIDR